MTGLFGLWLGTRWVINGATGLAKLLNLSHAFVGLGILAVGTDLPEVFVTVKASLLQLQGIESSGIITGNAMGSSISQISIILGIAGLFITFKVARKDIYRNGFFLVGSMFLLLVFGNDRVINRIEGAIMITAYLVYYILLLRSCVAGKDENSQVKSYSVPAIIFFLLFGLVVLAYSSHLVVENGMLLAEKWGVSQSFIGIAIIGLGTSLPELVVSIGAAFRKSAGLSVGNIIGSNIFDGLIPIGLGGVISQTKVESSLLYFDLPFLFAITILVLVFLTTQRGISQREGLIMISAYLLYIFSKVMMSNYELV
ncbi:MAG: sodium:calcium antiporter [Bacteroidia bacterium]